MTTTPDNAPTVESMVTGSDEAGWDFECAVGGCGPGATGGGFTSFGWDTRAKAEARGAQHLAEHESGEPMPSLDAFRAEQSGSTPTGQEG